MKLWKCPIHSCYLFYIWDSPKGLLPECQECHEERVKKGEIKFDLNKLKELTKEDAQASIASNQPRSANEAFKRKEY